MTPSKSLKADWTPNALTSLLERVADLILTLDRTGRILSIEVCSDELPETLAKAWKGRSIDDTLVNSSATAVRDIERVLEGADQKLDLVHRLESGGSELPVQYQLVALNEHTVLAAGTDLRPVASLKQQLVNAQHALEQDYWRLRQLETRYRRIFDMVGDAVLVLDAISMRVLEANPRANELLSDGDKGVVGRSFPLGFSRSSLQAAQTVVSESQSIGRSQVHNLLLDDGDTRVDVAVSFMRQAGEERFLIRIGTRDSSSALRTDASSVFLQEVIRNAPDAILMTDQDGRITAANYSFLELSQLVGEEQVLGHTADRWLGRSTVDLSVLLSNLREKSVVRLFSSTLIPRAGSPTQIEISACRLEEADGPAFALFIRDVERRITREHPVTSKLPSSIEQVTQRVGRVPLKELVRESTDIIEALCIETALEVTQDNRASAAELLGLSRQSLYAKLRRFNIGGSETDEAAVE
ncbi:MAG: transcriptional regulator PpsR [Pseudomonadota bacterium]